jgi:hypothetical protein
MELSKEIPNFVQSLVNSRGKLLKQAKGNCSDPVMIKHEKIAKALDYAKSISTTDVGWCKFLQKFEADIRYILIANRSLAAMENRLMLLIIEIQKRP